MGLVGQTGEWYELEETKIAELDNDINRGITFLHGRETEEGWEYAIVHWWYMSCSVQLLFRDGKVIEQPE